MVCRTSKTRLTIRASRSVSAGVVQGRMVHSKMLLAVTTTGWVPLRPHGVPPSRFVVHFARFSRWTSGRSLGYPAPHSPGSGCCSMYTSLHYYGTSTNATPPLDDNGILTSPSQELHSTPYCYTTVLSTVPDNAVARKTYLTPENGLISIEREIQKAAPRGCQHRAR